MSIQQLEKDRVATKLKISELDVNWITATDAQREKLLQERTRLDSKLNAISGAINAVVESERQQREAANEKAAKEAGLSKERLRDQFKAKIESGVLRCECNSKLEFIHAYARNSNVWNMPGTPFFVEAKCTKAETECGLHWKIKVEADGSFDPEGLQESHAGSKGRVASNVEEIEE